MYKKFPHYYQLNEKDCAPTCLRIISRYYGKSLDSLYVRELCKVNNEGASIANLSNAASIIGLRNIVFEISFENLLKKAILPCICFVNNSHFIVVYKTSQKYVWISDPSKGKIRYSHDDFKNSFLPLNTQTGKIIFFEPQPSFYNTNSFGEQNNVSISYLHIILKYLLQYKLQLIQLGIVMFLITLMQGTTPFIFRALLDVGVDRSDVAFIDIILIANLVLVISIAFSNFVKDWIIKHIGARFSLSIIAGYLSRLLDMPISYFTSHSTGDTLNRVKDHEKIKDFILNNLVGLIYSMGNFVLFNLILLYFHTTLFLIYQGGVIVYVIWVIFWMRGHEKLDNNYYSLNTQNQNFWIETLSNITDIKNYNYENKRRWKWENIQVQLYQLNLKMLQMHSVQNIGAQLINGAKNIFITFFSAKAVINGEMTLGMMISVQFMIGFLTAPIQQLIAFIQSYSSAKMSFIRLNEIHKTNFSEQKTLGKYNFDVPENKTISLKKVYFKYPNETTYILRNINVTIPFGKVTALIGKSGSGKSSMIKMLIRLYEVDEGDIEIGQIRNKDISIKKWRDCCASVLQETKIFSDTVINNIVLDEDEVDYRRVEEIINVIGLKEIINELPYGYNTYIGEKGRLLSQGQKQRILLARALYKKPDILFLDEATNALDQHSEDLILNNIKRYMQGKTIIIATHKLKSIIDADQILVFNNSTIIEQGNHDYLLEKRGYYYTLFKPKSTANTPIYYQNALLEKA